MRLIDADELSKTIKETCLLAKPWDYALIEQTIADAPTIEERKTGEWINRWAQNGDQVKEVRECTECGAAYLRYYDTADGFDCVPPKYCPNCGAKMEVEHESD